MKSVVRAFLFNPEGQILMTQHKKDTPWVLPGGHVETGEALHEAMIRELHEEFGLEVRFFEIDESEILHHRGKKLSMNPLPISSYNLSYTSSDGKDKSRIEYIFLMETDDTIVRTQVEEIHAYQWFEVEDILAMQANIETYDFIIEMLEKVVGEDELGE